MRHFTMAAAGFAVAAAGTAAIAAPAQQEFRSGLSIGQANTGTVHRTGTAICYSSLGVASPFDNFSGSGFSHGSTATFDDILMNKPAGTRIDEITFSVVSFNDDGTTPNAGDGGTVTTNAVIGLFNGMPDPGGSGLTIPDFSSPKAVITVTGLAVDSFTVNLFTIDVKDLNIIKKDEVMWAGVSFSGTTGPANADLTPLNDNMGQGIFGEATKGFSDDVFWQGGLSFFGGAPANPWANFGWEFRSVPTPGAMAIFGLAGLAATRRRR